AIARRAARLHCALAGPRLGTKSGPLRELLRRGPQEVHVSKLSEREISRRDDCHAKYGSADGLKRAAPAVDGDYRVGRGGCKAGHDVCPWMQDAIGIGADCGVNGGRGPYRTM